jgi:hypothetical protein
MTVDKTQCNYNDDVTVTLTGTYLTKESIGLQITGSYKTTNYYVKTVTDTSATILVFLPTNTDLDPHSYTIKPVINDVVNDAYKAVVLLDARPLATGMEADPANVGSGGGTVHLTIYGQRLKSSDIVEVYTTDKSLAFIDVGANIGSDNHHEMSIAIPANTSTAAKSFYFWLYIDDLMQPANVTITQDGCTLTPVIPIIPITPVILTEVTGFAADKAALPAAGGTVQFAVTGIKLKDAASLAIIGSEGLTASVPTSSDTENTVSLDIPANTTAADKTYTFYPVLNGVQQSLSATVTVAKAAVGSSGSIENFLQKNSYVKGTFTDVDESKWYGFDGQGVIAKAYQYGLMKGNSAASFNPMGNVTLAEAVAMASRVHKIYMTGDDSFVQGSPWYQVYIDYALANDMIQSGDFSNYTVTATRAQMAYIFANALPSSELGAQNTVGALPDVNAGTPYQTQILALYEAGVLSGSDAAGTFKPGDPISRAEAAAIISRVALPALRLSGRTYP